MEYKIDQYRIHFIIPISPPSINSLYNVFKHPYLHVKLKPEIVQFKSKVKQFVPKWEYTHTNELLYFNMKFYDSEFYFKNGKIRKVDITNTEKALLDAICEKIGVDDSYVKHRVLMHIESEKTYMEIEMGVLYSVSK